MNPVSPKKQNGFALLILVVMLMGIGGFVLIGYGQSVLKEVEATRFQHNQRVLKEAKQALLQFAYNYPVNFPNSGPGRLPCPDIDNDGDRDATAYCKSGGFGIIGRFPWKDADMNFYDVRDASRESLWYATSQNFANNPFQVINSDKLGTITIHDQSGSLSYNGSVAGVAAVIIAPGAITERNGVLQDRSTAPKRLLPVNYLDIFGTLDNAEFINSSPTNGFILGPVDDGSGSIVVNDQMIFITADEVIAMAEKAALDAYRNSIDDYQQNIWGGTIANYRYPWLDPYSSNDGLGTFDAVIMPAAPDPVIGRLPSMFADYFIADPNNIDSQIIHPRLIMSLDLAGERVLVSATPDIKFNGSGDLIITGANFVGYMWDGHNTTPHVNSPKDNVWEACPVVSGDEEDCNRDILGDFKGGTVSDVWLRVREVTFTFSSTPYTLALSNKTLTPLNYWRSPDTENPDPENHVLIAAEYNGSATHFSIINYSQDDEFQTSFGESPPGNNGSMTYNIVDPITIGLPYYPALPKWALDNDWHDSVMMAYSSAVQPGGDGACTPGTVGSAGPPVSDNCLTLLSSGGTVDNKMALLVLSGRDINGDVDIGLVDGLDDINNSPFPDDSVGAGGDVPPYFSDDLVDIFEGVNGTEPVTSTSPLYPELPANLTFDRRPNNDTGNDVVLVLE